MKLIEITGEEYNLLAKTEPFASFYQTSDYGDYMRIFNHNPIYVKYINNVGNCVALSMFLLKKETIITTRYTAYAPFGFLVNYYDEDALTSFNDELKVFLKGKKVNKIVIKPRIAYNDFVHNSLMKLNYRRSDDNHLYVINVEDHEEKKFNKNLIFKFKQLDENTTDFDHILLSYENEETYNALKHCADLYINQLDSTRSLNNLNESLKDDEKFIQRHKNDPKYEQKINAKLADIKDIKKIISQINKIEKTLGKDPILCISLIYKFNDEYYMLFIENKDEKDIFDSDNYLVNKLLSEAHDKGYQELVSLDYFPQAEMINLIGEYYLNI